MIKIVDGNLYDEPGNLLKKLSCPMRVRKNDLEVHNGEGALLVCSKCCKTIHDTDYMTESEIIDLFQKEPDACVSIHPLNPIFSN